MGHPRFLLSPDWRGDPSIHPVQFRWRLLSGNNRQLGRSAGSFDGVELARLAAHALRGSLDDCEPIVVRVAPPGRWLWSLLLDGEMVGVSGRSYETERAVCRALDLFLAGARQASLPLADAIPRPRSASADLYASDGPGVSW